METKVCDECDAQIGQTEEKCPKCGTDQAELDELANAVQRGQKIIEKRAKRNAPPAPPAPPAPQAEKSTVSSKLRGLGKVIK